MGGRLWFKGRDLPNGQVEEFVEDMKFPVCDLSVSSPRDPQEALYTCSIDDINRVSDALGIPWQAAKDISFSSAFLFTGFLWDLAVQTVRLTKEKHAKYLTAIAKWRHSSVHMLRNAQKLYGKLLHASHIIREGRVYLVHFKRVFPTFLGRPFMQRRFPAALLDDLQWWITTLSNSKLSRPIPGVADVIDIQAFSDTSSSRGIGICISSR